MNLTDYNKLASIFTENLYDMNSEELRLTFFFIVEFILFGVDSFWVSLDYLFNGNKTFEIDANNLNFKGLGFTKDEILRGMKLVVKRGFMDIDYYITDRYLFRIRLSEDFKKSQ